MDGPIKVTRRFLTVLLAPLILRAQAAASDEELSRFNSWLEHAKLPGDLTTQAAYKEKLIHDGMKPADADELVARLTMRLRTDGQGPDDPEKTRLTMNRMYSALEGADGSRTTQPNAFLVETVAGLRPGKALDLGMGLGRNSIFLAQKGWDVTGIDLSDVGIRAAQERARGLGVQVKAVVADVNRFELGKDQWDLVCILYFLIDERMPNLYERIAKGLKPGGFVVIEGVGLGELDAVLRAWSKWEPTKLRLLRLEYRADLRSDWGGAHVGRLLLKRPV
jgi:SAM-dependent methyltransferase